MRATDDQLREWQYTGHAYKTIAAKIATWAADKERGTVLPDNETFGVDASPSTYRRAKNFLVGKGVLETNDGPFYVA